MNSIVTKYMDVCIFCGCMHVETHHLIFGSYGADRNKADEDGLVIPLCHECHMKLHSNANMSRLSKMLGQACWEAHYGSRADFMKRYGQSYL